MELEESTFQTSDYTTKLQSSRQFGNGTKTQIQADRKPEINPCTYEYLIFAPLYILISFVKNKVPRGTWVYFQALDIFPFVYISVFVQYHMVLRTVSLQYNLKSGRLIPPAPFFFLRTALPIWGLRISIEIVKFFVLVL